MQLVLATKYTEARLGARWRQSFPTWRSSPCIPRMGALVSVGVSLLVSFSSHALTPPLSSLHQLWELPRSVALALNGLL